MQVVAGEFRGGRPKAGRAGWILVLIVVSPLFAGCVGDEPVEVPFSISRPDVHPGFRWTYETSIESGSNISVWPPTKEIQEFVHTEQLVSGDSVTERPGELRVVHTREPRYEEIDGTILLDRRDLGISVTCQDGCDVRLDKRHVDSLGPGGYWIHEYPATLEHLVEFPLEVGRSWTVAYDEYDHDAWNRVTDLRARAVERVEVDLPGIGEVDGIRIGASLTLESAVSLGQAIAGQWGEDVEGKQSLLMDYVYVPEARTITRMEVERELMLRGERDGEPIHGRWWSHSLSVLTDLALEPGTDYDPADAYRLVRQADGKEGVTGLGASPWPFELGNSTDSQPAGEGQTITFGPLRGNATKGPDQEFEALPPDHQGLWRIRWLEKTRAGDVRTEIAYEQGETLALEIENEGLHAVELLVLDESSRLVAVAETMVQGSGVRRVEDPFPVGTVETEHHLVFTTLPYLKNLTIDVSPGSVGEGTLTLTRDDWPDGEYPIEGETHIEHSMLYGQNGFWSSRWRVSYAEDHRIGELEMTVTAHYGSDQHPDWIFR